MTTFGLALFTASAFAFGSSVERPSVQCAEDIVFMILFLDYVLTTLSGALLARARIFLRYSSCRYSYLKVELMSRSVNFTSYAEAQHLLFPTSRRTITILISQTFRRPYSDYHRTYMNMLATATKKSTNLKT